MREYATPLSERIRQSRIHAERYWSDPDYRLRNINRWRRWKGLEPYESVEQIMSPSDVWANSKRDEKGRFA